MKPTCHIPGLVRGGACAALIWAAPSAIGADASSSVVAGTAAGTGAPVTHQVQTDFEGLFASDVQITQSSFGYTQKRTGYEVTASGAYNTYGLSYQPVDFDFLGSPTSVEERRVSGGLGGRAKLLDPLTLLVSGGLYEGFTDYRSAWLNEYYRQQFATLPGYVPAAPKGENISFGLRWEYLPAAGFVQGDIGYSHDRTAPGYEIDFIGLSRSRPDLYTASYHLAFENVLTRRIRVLNEFRLSDTTNREQRLGYQGSLNIAVDERWVVRAFGGYTQERPTFEAHYFGGTVAYEPADGWQVEVSGRYYHDSGEIENSLFSSAAPGLDSWQVGLGVRRVWGPHSFKVFVAPYFTDYQPAGIGTAFFQNLYKDRTWGAVQVAYGAEF